MHLKVSARFSLVDRPKGYKGLASAQYHFGHEKPLSFAQMCAAIVGEVAEWYCELEEPETLNHEVQSLRQWLRDLKFDAVLHSVEDGEEA